MKRRYLAGLSMVLVAAPLPARSVLLRHTFDTAGQVALWPDPGGSETLFWSPTDGLPPGSLVYTVPGDSDSINNRVESAKSPCFPITASTPSVLWSASGSARGVLAACSLSLNIHIDPHCEEGWSDISIVYTGNGSWASRRFQFIPVRGEDYGVQLLLSGGRLEIGQDGTCYFDNLELIGARPPAPIPALSPTAFVLLVVALLSSGVLVLRRSRSPPNVVAPR